MSALRREKETLKEEASSSLGEARTVLPGIQALFGFQLIAVFNERFSALAAGERLSHFVSLLLVAVSAALVMSPAAYDRIAERGVVTDYFIGLASLFITAAMVFLMFGLSLDVYVVAQIVFDDNGTSIAVASGMLLFLALTWFVFPLYRRHYRRV
jgi:hypothetical protein